MVTSPLLRDPFHCNVLVGCLVVDCYGAIIAVLLFTPRPLVSVDGRIILEGIFSANDITDSQTLALPLLQ